MKTLLFAVIAAVTSVVVADTPVALTSEKSVTKGPAKVRVQKPVKLYVKPGSAKGCIAVVNCQTRIDEKEFIEASEKARSRYRFAFSFVKSESEAKDALVILRIIDEAGKPAMTVSPEAGRGEINVAGLSADLTTDSALKKFLIPRARREFLRLVAYAFCAGGSQFPNNLMSAVASVRDLDYVSESLPVDTLQSIARNAKKRGFVPEHAVDYDMACQEGWAPQPSTDEERKIWDEVHAMPSNPIKIKYDPKRDK